MENIYIQWHFTTHGLAYFKHILSAFYSGKCSLKQRKIFAEKLSQEAMNKIFDKATGKGFVFDKIYYLTADAQVFNKIVTYNILKKQRFYKDDELLKEKNLISEWEKIINKNLSIVDEFRFIENHFPEKKKKY